MTTPDWSSIGAKRRGKKGWLVSSARKARGVPWAIDVGPIHWPTESFWRVGLCVETYILVEQAHLRFDTETEAFEAVQYLAAMAAANA